ncbi:MAG TPA: UTP--glucose-1-phosphate uridylyltransferase GalU [Kofleriaceae bacterium]|jgi:UTP--glucose-1-phosphate uridylyltransferase|nr:UTP--glucose-1-phosphate uridylyltransferase GalU [Kofleriaceae bacterium]
MTDRHSVRKAVIPAAGLGTRFLPAAKAVPKEMLPIVDVPTIQLVIDEAVRAGITDVVVINGRNKHAIEDHFDHAYELEHTLRERGNRELAEAMTTISSMVRLISVRQKQPLGLGHAVLCAREVIGDESFAVLLGDDLIDNDDDPGIAQLVRVHQETGAAAIAIMEVPSGKEHMYGIVAGDHDARGRMRIREMVEKPTPGTAPSRWAIVGRYVLPPAVWPHLASTKPGSGGEIQLTDALRELAGSEQGMYGVVVNGTRHDAGDKLGYLRANLAYALKRPALREGVLALCRELLAMA